MQAVSRVSGVRRHVETLENVEGAQGCDALPVRWNFPDIDASVIGADRRYPIAFMRPQVGGGDDAARLSREVLELLCECAVVKGGCVRRGDALERAGVIGQPHDLADPRGAAPQREGLAPAAKFWCGQASVTRGGPRPVFGEDRSNWKAVAGVKNRRFKQALELEPPEFGVQITPRGGRTGHSHGQPTEARHSGVTSRLQQVSGQPLRGATTGVQAVQLRAVPDERERITANAVAGRLDDG